MADRIYLPTADGGRAITDAVTESLHIVNVGRALAGEEPLAPKQGARFHFELPGSVQGFLVDPAVDSAGSATLENVAGHSTHGSRSLAIRYRDIATGRTARVGSPTFIPSLDIAEYFARRGYELHASPALYPGQTVHAEVEADRANAAPVQVNIFVSVFQDPDDHLAVLRGDVVELAPGERCPLTWTLPDTAGAPIAQVGIELHSDIRANGTAYLDYLTWDGTPHVTLTRTPGDSPASRFSTTNRMWRRAWINGVDQFDLRWPEPFRLAQNEGVGLLIQGGPGWSDYEAASAINIHLAKCAGIAARVQGMRRYYALVLCRDGMARLIKALDGDTVLAETAYPWSFGATKEFKLRVTGNRLQGSIDGQTLFDIEDNDRPLRTGGVAFLIEEGRITSQAMSVAP